MSASVGGVPVSLAVVAGAALGATSVQPDGTSGQVLRGDGSAGTVPPAALTAPAANVRGGVALPASPAGLFLRDDGAFASTGGGGGGARYAIDGSTPHAYLCDSLGPSLADTGSSPAAPLVLYGAAGSDYVNASARPFKLGTRGVRFLAALGANHGGGAQVTGLAVSGSGAISIEGFAIFDELLANTTSVNMLVALDDGTTNNIIEMGVLNSISVGTVFCGVNVAGAGEQTNPLGPTSGSVTLGAPTHLLAVYDPAASPCLKIYVNGALSSSSTFASMGVMPALTRFTIGNRGAYDSAMRGWVGEVRVSNVARSAAYALAAAEAAFGL